MSYFESVSRDGPGRTGILKSGEMEIDTPALINMEAGVLDFGSPWGESTQVTGEPDIVVPPSKRCPPGLDRDYTKYLGLGNEDLLDNFESQFDGSTDSLVMPVIGGGRYSGLRNEFSQKLSDYDVVLVDMAAQLYIPHELVSIIVSIKKGVGFDTAVYAPAIATPPLIPLLVYMGIDLVDSYRAMECASDNVFFTQDGNQKLDSLEETPCQCEVCLNNTVAEISGMSGEETYKAIYRHNLRMLQGELKRTRNALRRGLLRELVEERVKSTPSLTAGLRKLDHEYHGYLEGRTPSFKRYSLHANTVESLGRPEIQRFIDRVKNRFKPPGSEVAVILPCSARKPYSKSKSHSVYRKGTMGRGDEVILTSPLGLVPRELEIVYPAQHYDIPVTGVWLEEEKKLIRNCLTHYFKENDYRKVFVHIDGEMAALCRDIFSEIGVTAEYTTPNKDPRSDESIERLKKAMEGYPKRKHRYRDMIRSIADYQFGVGVGEKLLEDSVVKGSYPRFRVSRKNGEQLATLVPQYGMLALTIEGVKKTTPDKYHVEIGGFYPKGSLLSPGVIDASREIRPNDEVWFTGEKAIGVGRAEMSGSEMKSSDRGIAVKVRHVEER